MGINDGRFNRGLLFSELATKKKIFISYHHANDQFYYDEFSRFYSGIYDVFTDRSLRGSINSNNSDYVMRKIREDYITGSSCTILLCGKESYKRKYIDWEIKATLDKNHGLLAIQLPTLINDLYGKVNVPKRLADNIDSGYAVWVHWNQLDATNLNTLITQANSSHSLYINNSAPIMKRNG